MPTPTAPARTRPTRLTVSDAALTASAERVTGTQANRYRRLNQAWQLTAFSYYRSLGECYFPAQFYAHAMPSIRFYAGVRDAQGNVTELDAKDWASEQFSRIQDPGGGRSQLLTAYGKLQFLIGDCYLVGFIDPEKDEGWEVLSPSELRGLPGQDDKFARVKYPGAPIEELSALPDDDFQPVADGIVVYRIWQRDPEYTFLSDSSVRSILDLYGQLTLAQLAVQARLQSRISNAKVMLIADELDFPAPDGQNNEDPQADALATRLAATFVQPIKEPGTASAVAPPMIRVPADMIAAGSAMAVIDVAKADETYQEIQLRDELRNRISLGVDLPAEIMLGKGDANHWSGWAIDDDAWKSHLKPPVISFSDDIGRQYLRPIARQEGKLAADGSYTGKAAMKDADGGQEEVTGTLVVWYDESEVVNHPDRAEDMRQGYKDGVIGPAKYREAIGADPIDAPTEEEIPQMLEFLKGRVAIQDPSVAPAGDSVKGSDVSNTAKAIPDETAAQSAQLQDEDSSVQASALAERCLGAAEVAVSRCYSLAGSRVRSKKKLQEHPSPNTLLAAAVGLEACENLGSTADLVKGGAEDLRGFLLASGLPPSTVDRIGRLVEAHAAATLFEPALLGRQATAFIRRLAGGIRQVA